MDALLLVDKPSGFTSQDVLTAIKRAANRADCFPCCSPCGFPEDFKIDRIGHAGTLDPLGTGLLIVLLNGATPLQELFLGDVKEYEGVFKLGVSTTTDDIEGGVLRETSRTDLETLFASFNPETLLALASRFTGTFLQHPPAVSSVHVNGERSYKIARRDERENRVATPPAAREITVFELTLAVVDADDGEFSPRLRYRVRASKGTYVRSLARDLGEFLGCGAVVETLRRTRSGQFSVERAAPCAIVERTAQLTPTSESLIPIARALSDLPQVALPQQDCRRVLMGERAPLGLLNNLLGELPVGGWARVVQGAETGQKGEEMLSFMVQKTAPGFYSDGIPLQIRYRVQGRL